MNGVDDIVVFGTQYVFKYIQEMWQEHFFTQPKNEVCQEAKEYLSLQGENYKLELLEELVSK
jgi:nicotinamide phosphoribosyltransferase